MCGVSRNRTPNLPHRTPVSKCRGHAVYRPQQITVISNYNINGALYTTGTQHRTHASYMASKSTVVLRNNIIIDTTMPREHDDTNSNNNSNNNIVYASVARLSGLVRESSAPVKRPSRTPWPIKIAIAQQYSSAWTTRVWPASSPRVQRLGRPAAEFFFHSRCGVPPYGAQEDPRLRASPLTCCPSFCLAVHDRVAHAVEFSRPDVVHNATGRRDTRLTEYAMKTRMYATRCWYLRTVTGGRRLGAMSIFFEKFV